MRINLKSLAAALLRLSFTQRSGPVVEQYKLGRAGFLASIFLSYCTGYSTYLPQSQYGCTLKVASGGRRDPYMGFHFVGTWRLAAVPTIVPWRH